MLVISSVTVKNKYMCMISGAGYEMGPDMLTEI